MRKITALTVFLLVVIVNIFGQEMLNLNRYATYFLNNNGRLDRPYLRAATDEDYNRIAALGGDELSLDTPLEIASLSICPGVADIRPAEANRMLGTPKQADQKLGAAVFQEIQILRFLNASGGSADNTAVNRHEAVLKFITDRGNVTRAQVEAYYRNGIRALISDIVDEEFNKVSFSMSNNAIRKGYNATLTRVANNQYVLEYEGVYQGKDFHEKLPPASLEALLATMRRDTENFDQDCVDTIRTQATLIPAVSGIGKQAVEPTVLLVNILTSFYTAETIAQKEHYYRALLGLYIRYQQLVNAGEGIRATPATHSLIDAIKEISPALAVKFGQDIRQINVSNARFSSSSRDEVEALASWR
jgi:hypothetical protein